MRFQPFTHKKLLGLFILLAAGVGGFIDYAFDTQADYWLHDSAIVYQQRKIWKYTGVVVLDDAVPFRITRIQALPLFARAIEHLVAQGAQGIFLDARVSKELEGRMPYALCIEADAQVRWSQPECQTNRNLHTNQSQCNLINSQAGNAPLKMSAPAIARFRTAPYLNNTDQLPDFLLYDWAAAEAISPDGLVASDRLVTKATPVARWLDMSEDHAVFKLIQLLAPAQAASLYQKNRLDENCDDNLRCRRLRFSQPLYATSLNPDRLILPLSQLASCDENIAKHTAALLKNKLVILQATSPTESTDIMVTPMTVAMWGPQLMTPGAQFIVDQIETVLNQDFPRPPPPAIRIALIAGLALTSVLLGAYFSQTFLWLGGLAVFMIMVMLCFLNPLTQLWPVTAAMASYLCGALLMVAAQLISGFRQSHLLAEYLPKQVLTLLLPLPVNELFKHRRCNAVVLMSDLAGYTTLTGLLKDPEHVMNLMNDYLDATSIVLQDKYNGTLEAYVGDMVCYYWEYEPENAELTFKNALSGAIELALLQKTFFSSVTMRYRDILDPDVIEKVGKNINAGIGVTAGEVVKGNLGPKHGIKKFTILGDPINLASRIESLTRLFNTEIIVVGDFASTIAHEGLAVRRLAAVSVKGRAAPIILYALGVATDIRFAAEEVRAWELWSAAMEAGGDTQLHCPEIFRKDQQTILDWHQRGLQSENGVWVLHEK